MIYKIKKGSKSYDFVKEVLEAEEQEKQAYFKRVEDAIGFEINTYKGFHPNNSINRAYTINSLLVNNERWNALDKKVWKRIKEFDGYVEVVPIRKTKKGKEIAKLFNSYKSIANHYSVYEGLCVTAPDSLKFTISKLISHNDMCFVFFDDCVRADKENKDLMEITMNEYENLINK